MTDKDWWQLAYICALYNGSSAAGAERRADEAMTIADSARQAFVDRWPEENKTGYIDEEA